MRVCCQYFSLYTFYQIGLWRGSGGRLTTHGSGKYIKGVKMASPSTCVPFLYIMYKQSKRHVFKLPTVFSKFKQRWRGCYGTPFYALNISFPAHHNNP